ncbi:MAG: molybdopterin cofactor-binding domain-containing protein [Gammaproteobacteria bacterium]
MSQSYIKHFIGTLNEAGKGVVQVDFPGGPEVNPRERALEQGKLRGISLVNAIEIAGMLPRDWEMGLAGHAIMVMPDAKFPNGAHVCEVEIDPETGLTTIVNYVVVDDVGTVINPMLVKGQVHGGIAHGIGQAILEQVCYELDSGRGHALAAINE